MRIALRTQRSPHIVISADAVCLHFKTIGKLLRSKRHLDRIVVKAAHTLLLCHRIPHIFTSQADTLDRIFRRPEADRHSVIQLRLRRRYKFFGRVAEQSHFFKIICCLHRYSSLPCRKTSNSVTIALLAQIQFLIASPIQMQVFLEVLNLDFWFRFQVY